MLELFFASEARTVGEVVLYLSVITLFEVVFVILAPFWVGTMMKIKTKTKLILVPVVPYLAMTILRFILATNYVLDRTNTRFTGEEPFLNDLALRILVILVIVIGLSTLVSWIVAWVICGLDRNYDTPELEASEGR